MNQITFKHKKFCDEFIKSFDFNQSCEKAKVNKNKMLILLYNENSLESQYIKQQVDINSLQNSYITKDTIVFEISKIVLYGENKEKIQAAKLLLNIDEDIDKSGEFIKIIEKIKGS